MTTPDSAAHTGASPEALLVNAAGNYRILPGGAAYCTGIVPEEGFEVVRVQLDRWLPLAEAYAFIEAYLVRVKRPVQAFCGIEMRVPAPLSRADWSSFNTPYLQRLQQWGLMHGELSGVCRSNIALLDGAPATASMCAFSYTAPTVSKNRGFCLSGTADIASDGRVIADGDTSSTAMQKRTRFTIDVVSESLAKLGLSWRAVQQIAIFHVHPIPGLWDDHLLGGLGDPLRQGIVVYRARPPIVGGEVELEARGARRDLIETNV
ncbi:2-amino-5-chloromuconate deaminase CnbZ [Variovorax sp. RT4R15]|uniref:2-amino-5-chloromuconate deaminase CnbZ n=1 Tax=Variovorax sp. RT4R15 TaxID=3443737 RepID=UPI003F453124